MTTFCALTLITLLGFTSTGAFDHYKPDPHLQCEEESNPRTRTFLNLQKYQKNAVSFIKGQDDFIGNYVKILDRNMTHLVKNDFLTKTSKYIIKLSLDDKQIMQISDGTFDYLDCLKYLELQQNRIREITTYTFHSLPRLMGLNLSYNFFEALYASSFEELKHLVNLDLSHNNIRAINKFTFINLLRLKQLDLSFNKLDTINPPAFSQTPVLNSLYLNNNGIKDTKVNDWENLSYLTKLDLGNNSIEDFNLTIKFSLSQLEILNLTDNKISRLNATNLVEHLPKLKRLDFNNNLFKCPKLQEILDVLEVSIDVVGRENSRSNLDKVFCIRDGYVPHHVPSPKSPSSKSPSSKSPSSESSSSENPSPKNPSSKGSSTESPSNPKASPSKGSSEILPKDTDDPNVKHKVNDLQSQLSGMLTWIVVLVLIILLMVSWYVIYKTNMVQRCRQKPGRRRLWPSSDHMPLSDVSHGTFLG